MKKFVSILLTACLLLSAGVLCTAAAEETKISFVIAESADITPEDITGEVLGYLGDVDQSQNVNIKDATAIQKFVASIIDLPDNVQVLADTDLSGDVTVRDATAIQKHLASITDEFYIEHLVYLPDAVDKRIIGKWEGTMDAAGIINELIPMFADDPLLAEHVQIESFEIKQTYEFKNDYTYTLTVDEEVLAASVAKVKLELEGDFANYFEALSAEMGLPMTADQMLALMGYSSMTELVDEMFPTDMLEEAATATNGVYRTEDNNKIYMDVISDTYFEYYTIEGDVLTITGNSDDLYPEEYPLIFNRVK